MGKDVFLSEINASISFQFHPLCALAENERTPRRKQAFPEAELLLTRVQQQYNHVRVESLQDTLEAKDAIMSALRRMEKVLEHDGDK